MLLAASSLSCWAGLRLVVRGHRNDMEWHTIKVGMPPGLGMIADDQRKIAREFPFRWR
jgi:hypothetical protein